MPSGNLGQSAPVANTLTTIYTVPAGKTASFSMNVLNTSDNVAVVDIAISTTGSPATHDWIEKGVSLQPSGILERTGLVAGAGMNLVIRSSVIDVAFNAYGFEG